jgi:pyruvyltransferase
MKHPKAYWLDTRLNWGDVFTPFLFKEAFGIEVEHAYLNEEFTQTDAELFSCGSLIDRIPDGFSGHVLGSGIGLEETRRDLRNVKTPLLLRGPLTAERCQYQQTVRFGDPGLLASMFVDPGAYKAYRFGIVPHYVDKKHQEIDAWVQRGALQIDIEAEIRSVINAVAHCEMIVSSSLHGLVIADSLGIPSAYVKLGRLEGNEFKFHDYYRAYGETCIPCRSITEGFHSCRSRDVSFIKKNVLDVFNEYADEISADI